MAASRGHGWWPYLGPYGLFLILVEIGSRTPESAAGAMLLVKVLLPGALVLHFARRGDYPELSGYRPGAAGFAADVLCGLVITALWMGPFLLLPGLERGAPEDAFDPAGFAPLGAGVALGVRLLGFGVVTPFVEELFVRSFVIRLVDVIDTGEDFRSVPIARFTWRSFVITAVWFTFTHVPWEWGVAAVAGVVFNLWLYQRRHIGSPIVAHAVANASIWAIVVLGPGDLWVFL